METLTSPPPITTTTTVATSVKTPDSEYEPPQSTVTKQPIPPPPFTNGVLKRHKPLNHHHHHHEPPHLVLPAIYKECLKNHAASIGGHAIDGCGEFMPSPTSSPSYPTSLKCAACGCHRNFHRREQEEPIYQHLIEYQPHHRHHPPPPPQTTVTSPGNSPSPPPISSSYYPSAPHMLLALSTGLSAPPPEPHNFPAIPTTPGHTTSNKKRFRTKFTQQQKDKMMEIAEQVGWKMQKRDEELINGFCNEIGVDRNVFKVWMHNNKSSSNKKDFVTTTNNNANNINVPIDFIISPNHNIHNHNHDHHRSDNDNSGITHHHHLNGGGGGGGGGGGDMTNTGRHDNNLMLRSITKGSTSSS